MSRPYVFGFLLSHLSGPEDPRKAVDEGVGDDDAAKDDQRQADVSENDVYVHMLARNSRAGWPDFSSNGLTKPEKYAKRPKILQISITHNNVHKAYQMTKWYKNFPFNGLPKLEYIGIYVNIQSGTSALERNM
jgi:hypothetical protein